MQIGTWSFWNRCHQCRPRGCQVKHRKISHSEPQSDAGVEIIQAIWSSYQGKSIFFTDNQINPYRNVCEDYCGHCAEEQSPSLVLLWPLLYHHGNHVPFAPFCKRFYHEENYEMLSAEETVLQLGSPHAITWPSWQPHTIYPFVIKFLSTPEAMK